MLEVIGQSGSVSDPTTLCIHMRAKHCNLTLQETFCNAPNASLLIKAGDLGIVLGPMLEGSFFNSMIKANVNTIAFFGRPIAPALGIVSVRSVWRRFGARGGRSRVLSLHLKLSQEGLWRRPKQTAPPAVS